MAPSRVSKWRCSRRGSRCSHRRRRCRVRINSEVESIGARRTSWSATCRELECRWDRTICVWVVGGRETSGAGGCYAASGCARGVGIRAVGVLVRSTRVTSGGVVVLSVTTGRRISAMTTGSSISAVTRWSGVTALCCVSTGATVGSVSISIWVRPVRDCIRAMRVAGRHCVTAAWCITAARC